MIGTLGGIVFQASTEVVRTFKELSRSRQARIHKHMVISQKPRLEFLGMDTDAITIPVRLDVSRGVNPMKELQLMQDLMSSGERLAMVIGGKYYGDFVIEKLDETHERTDGQGNILVASVNMSLTESVAG